MKTLLFFYSFLIIVHSSLAQSAGNAIHQNPSSVGNSIGNNYGSLTDVRTEPSLGSTSSTTLKAEVMMNVQASSYVAILSCTQAGETVIQTDSLMDVRLNNVFDELIKAGIPIENTHVDFISMLPIYEFEMTEKRYSKTMNEVPTGFEMKKNIHVRFNQHDRLNDLIAAAAKAEMYDLVKVEYNVEAMDRIYNELRIKAEEILQQKTESFTRIGFDLQILNYNSNQGSVYPADRYVKYLAANTGIPKTYSKRASKDKPIEYNYADKNTTVYYEKLPYSRFDVVLNADALEPTVQFYYSVTAQYKLQTLQQAKREAEDRDLDLELRRAQLRAQIKAVNGTGSAATVNNHVTVKTK